MNRHVAVKVLVLVGLMCAAMWSIAVPNKKSSPYISALEVVTVKTAYAACGFRCSAPTHAICLTAPIEQSCNQISGNHCLTGGCME